MKAITTNMNATGMRWFARHKACGEARGWAATQPTLERAWARCTNPQWLLWALAHQPARRRPTHRNYVRFALWCARQASPTDERSRAALRVVARWLRGRATDEEVRAAAYSAEAAAGSAWAAADSAWAAAYSAWAAADSARAAAYSTWAAAYSARAAADSTWAAADSAQCKAIRRIFACPWGRP